MGQNSRNATTSPTVTYTDDHRLKIAFTTNDQFDKTIMLLGIQLSRFCSETPLVINLKEPASNLGHSVHIPPSNLAARIFRGMVTHYPFSALYRDPLNDRPHDPGYTFSHKTGMGTLCFSNLSGQSSHESMLASHTANMCHIVQSRDAVQGAHITIAVQPSAQPVPLRAEKASEKPHIVRHEMDCWNLHTSLVNSYGNQRIEPKMESGVIFIDIAPGNPALTSMFKEYTANVRSIFCSNETSTATRPSQASAPQMKPTLT